MSTKDAPPEVASAAVEETKAEDAKSGGILVDLPKKPPAAAADDKPQSKPSSAQPSEAEEELEDEDLTDDPSITSSKGRRGSGGGGKKRQRCGKCEACLRSDCGQCFECVRKKKFGGTGESKQACIKRRCVMLAEWKKERKRSRAAGEDNSLLEDLPSQVIPVPKKKAKRRRSGNNASTSSSLQGGDAVPSASNSVVPFEEKDPMVTQLIDAFPTPPPSLLAMNHVNPNPKQPSECIPCTLQDYKYGRKVPEPARDICAGCRCEKPPSADPDAPTETEPIILLCDGPGCDTEWHLECCLPPIAEVPQGSYFCIDCHPSGSSSLIEQYFDRMEERRAKAMEEANFKDPNAFLHLLWTEDLEDNRENWNEHEYIPAKDGRVPQSELSRLLDLQQHLVGDMTSNKPCTFEQLAGLFIGKPVRLYCPLDDNYHSGRIVEYRRVPANLHQMTPAKKAPKVVRDASFLPNDDFFASQVEFLVRFNPGSDEYRKTLLYKWLRLEEHSLAVGTHLIFGKFHHPGNTPTSTPKKGNAGGGATVSAGGPPSSWQQACVFLRTSRELMPVLHLLKEKYGEVNYHPAGLLTSSKGGSKKNKDAAAFSIPKNAPKKNPVYCLAKRFGVSQSASQTIDNPALSGESYKMLHLIDQTRDLFSRKPSNSHIEQLKHSLACVEHEEQQAAKRWWRMRRRKLGYSAPNALRMRDEHALGPVLYQTSSSSILSDKNNNKQKVHEQELCPLVRAPGLDRGHLMERLVRCGMIEDATKDTAAGLECWLVPE